MRGWLWRVRVNIEVSQNIIGKEDKTGYDTTPNYREHDLRYEDVEDIY